MILFVLSVLENKTLFIHYCEREGAPRLFGCGESICSENALLLPPVDISLQLAGGTRRTAPGHHEVFTHGALDVVFGPVNTADGHAQTTQAALVHVIGNGAAQAAVAEETAEANSTVVAAIEQGGLKLRRLESPWLVCHSHDHSQAFVELRGQMLREILDNRLMTEAAVQVLLYDQS